MRLAMLLPLVALPAMTMSALAVDAAAAGKYSNDLSSLLRQANNNRAAAQGRNDDNWSRRNLQRATTPGSGFCVEGSGPNTFVEGNFETVAFATDFGPNCTCSKGGSGSNITATILELDMTATEGDAAAKDAFVARFNEELDRFESEAQSSCANDYETCFENDEYCGNMEVSQVYKFGLGSGNFATFDEIVAWRSQTPGTADITLFYILDFFSDLTDKVEVDIEFCLTYTKGEFGTVCVEIEIEEDMADNAVEVSCNLSYNGVACDSCSFNVDTECITASCDVHGISNIDSCDGNGIRGSLYLFECLQQSQYCDKRKLWCPSSDRGTGECTNCSNDDGGTGECTNCECTYCSNDGGTGEFIGWRGYS